LYEDGDRIVFAKDDGEWGLWRGFAQFANGGYVGPGCCVVWRRRF
jgi:hypothetical protein